MKNIEDLLLCLVHTKAQRSELMGRSLCEKMTDAAIDRLTNSDIDRLHIDIDSAADKNNDY